jgi:transcriptional regulator GlxA family with amidase domain
MRRSVDLINRTKGNITVDCLASEACLSRRQFERIFLAYIGISPKQFLKIVRFQNAIFINHNSNAKSLTDLALKAGYYDQSHFINEMKELTGYTPKKLFYEEEIISDLFI